MRKLEIILDSDGILFNCIDKVLALYNEEYNDNLKVEDITDFDLTKFAKKGSDIQKYFKQIGYFKDLPPIAGAQYYVEKLIKDGHDVVVATASHKNGVVDKIDAIEENYPFINNRNIIIVERKDKLVGDVIFDDGLHNLINTRCKYPVIMDYPWNRNLSGKYKSLSCAKRVYLWEQFYNYVTEIAHKKVS